MTTKTKRIDTDVLEMLSRIGIVDNALCTHEAPQMDRDLYVRFNKVVEALGGKWKRGKGHVFAEPIGDRIDAVIATGSYECPRLEDFFPTPEDIAARMVRMLRPPLWGQILEPSAGDGALLQIAGLACDPGARLFAYESNHHRALALVNRFKGVKLAGFDFMAGPQVDGVPDLFDFILMNPPFSKRQDVKHILRAWDLLADGGRLVAIASAGVLFRQNAEEQKLRALIHAHGSVEELPEGTFKQAGTMVNTVIVELRK